MATSLASQLRRLATPQTTLLDQKRSRRSILFDPSEAAKYGRDVYYDIGRSGIQSLVATDKAFQQFEEPLFGRASKELQRAVEDKVVNTELNKNINHFLLLLSPYLEKEAALKALEWLVYRFLAHEMNQRALLMCIFPFYESALFIRILQVMDVHQEAGEWHWLRGAQKTGRPLPKQTVFTRWGHNQAFRAFLAEYLKKMLKVHPADGNFSIAASFYITTVLGGLCLLKEVEEEHLSSVVKMVPRCLASGKEPLVAGVYLTLAHLSTRTQLTQDLLNTLLSLMIKTHPAPESLKEQCVLCLLVLSQHQGVAALEPPAAATLHASPALLTVLGDLARTKGVAALLSAYTTGYISYLVGETCKLPNHKKSAQFQKLAERLQSVPMSSSDASKVIWCLFEAIKTHHKPLLALPGLSLGETMRGLEASHPEGHGQAMARLAALHSHPQAGDTYRMMLKEFLGTQSGGTSFTHLVHPEDSIRLAAVEGYLQRVARGTEEEQVVRLHLKNMLTDDLPEIPLQALSSPRGLATLEAPYLVGECQKLLSRAALEGKRWAKVRLASLKVLTRTLVDHYDENLSLSVLYVCLPYVLFPKSPGELSAARVILQSKLAKKSTLLSLLEREMAPFILAKKVVEYSNQVWKALPRVMSGLAREEHLALWSQVECQPGQDDSLRSHFMAMVLLNCSLAGGHQRDSGLQLKVAHRLLDACLTSLDYLRVSTGHTGGGTAHLSPQDITTYLEEVLGGSLPVAFIAQSLQRALQGFTLPGPCTTTHYWTPFLESEPGEGSLLLLTKVLRGAMQLERHGTVGGAARDAILAAVLKEHLKTPKERFYFLAFIWGWHSSLAFSNLIDEALQTWTLNLGAALLASRSSSLAWALGTSQPLVPALVSALTSGAERVRQGAVGCARRLGAVMGGSLTQDSHTSLLHTLLTQAEELVDDESQLSSLLASTGEKKLRSTRQEVTQGLLGMVTSDTPPTHIKAALLYALTSATEPAVLFNLLPLVESLLDHAVALPDKEELDVCSSLCLYYTLLRFTPEASEVLETEAGWALFLRAVHFSKPILHLHQDTVSPQDILMEQVMSRKFLASLRSEEVQSKLWSVLISRVVESEDHREAASLRRALRKVVLDAEVIAKQIANLSLTSKTTSIRGARAKRMKLKDHDEQQGMAWQKLSLMLETIGVMGSLGRPWLLVPPLCQCLQQTLTLDLASTTLLQQQLLSALLHLLQKSTEELGEDGVREKVQVNVELIVQCIRSSLSHDTHRRAMLILAFTAKIAPDTVMHNMMAIFTFMGTSLLPRDDSYSFQVIHQTIESIVPALIKSVGSKEGGIVEARLAQVCQVFVDALPDLPHHRRLPLFTQLATVLQARPHLWLLLALLADSYVMRGGSVRGEDERGAVPQVIQFALTLAAQFPAPVQAVACCRLVKYISTLPEEKEGVSGKLRNDQDVIVVEAHSPRQMCHFKYIATDLVAHLLASETFVGQVFEASEEQQAELRPLYKELLEATMCYLQALTTSCDLHKDKPGGRLLSALHRKVMEVLDGVNSILPPSMLLQVTQELLVSPLPTVRCHATEILCAKLQPNSNFFRDEDVPGLEGLMKVLRKASLCRTEPLENRQTSLFSLQLLTKFLAPRTSTQTLQPVLSTAMDLVCQEDVEVRVQTQGLLVAAEAVAALKVAAVAHLGRLMPVLTRLLAQPQPQDTLLLAALTTLHKVVENLPQLLSPYLGKVMTLVCGLHGPKEEAGGAGKESRLAGRLAGVRDALVARVEVRILIPRLIQTYGSLEDPTALQTLLGMVERLVEGAEARVLMGHRAELVTLFTHALDARTLKGDLDAVQGLEEVVFRALGKLLLRLNEHDNVSVFQSLQTWALGAKDKPARLISFYRFADHLAGQYKVLFIIAKLAEGLLPPTASLLGRLNTQPDTVFGPGRQGEGRTCLLLGALLDTLTKIFLYDSVGFVTQERFQLILAPLTSQLDNRVGGVEEYQRRVTNHLVPCLTKFTIAVGDDSLWKTLNREVLARLKNEEQPEVVLAALETFRALVETLGEDYLQPLLADTMPAIMEALESSHPEVEAATRQIFTKMEAVLGDSLRAYLDF